jgi:hypothetical protein
MPSAKFALAAGLAAISLSACGTAAKPVAGTLKASTTAHKGVDDPRKKHIQCLQQDHIPVVRLGTTAMQIARKPYGPTVYFEPTPGIAQGLQIAGGDQGAEVIGAALLYPNLASDKLLAQVEACVAQGVSG